MTGESPVTMRREVAAVIAIALVLAGAGASYLLVRSGSSNGTTMPTVVSGSATGTAPSGAQPPAMAGDAVVAPLPDVVVPLTADAVERAGIVAAPVSSGAPATEMRLPGVVAPNAYREVAVTPLVAGRVTRVSAELGDRVRRGQALAEIYSPELSEAQTRFVSARAMLDAHDRELQRTEKLVEIGAASRQELERIHAEHAAQTAGVQSARAQLVLLGVPASTIDALESGSTVNAMTRVPAPIDGVITDRAANLGLNVDSATKLFTVVDLSTVWIVADVYERDFARVRVGTEVTVTTTAYPDLARRGRVSYIDPQVDRATRTAKARIEVPNPRGELRLGMYAEVVASGATGASRPVVPRTAVQHVGDRTVVYLSSPNAPGTFTEREVRLGEVAGEQVEVISGVQSGDVVVTEGSFFVRAERERLGLRRTAAAAATLQSATVLVTEQGFEPSKVALRAGVPARLTFLRTTEKTCGTEVVFPALNIKRALPLNEPVLIELTPAKSGEIAFACGMNMLKGIVVVE